MAGSINFSGIVSGIDTNQIVSEMLSIERQPEQIYQTEQTNLQAKQTAYTTVSAQLVGLQEAAEALTNVQAFQAVTATSSNTAVASVTAQAGAQVGNHTLTVNTLAQAQVISSLAQTSETAPLNFSGQIIINGKAVNVQSADSLQSLAANINAADAGVTASILTPTVGQYYLTLGSTNSGLQGQIQLSDVGSGNLLSTLGLVGSSNAINHSTSNGPGSNLFTSSTTGVATLLGQTTPASGTVQITTGSGTTPVTINLSQSLSQIATTINTALGSSAATVATVTNPVTGASEQQLQIAGATAFTDNNNVLADLGILSNSISNLTSSGAGSALFTDSATSVATLLGQTVPSSGTVQITTGSGTSNVTIDLSQSLSQIATTINTALGGTPATVATVTNPITGASEQQLQIAGVTAFTDSNNVLANLGLYAKPAATQLVQAQNASFTLDGLAATRATNTVSDAISGVTFTLLQDSTSSSSGTAPSTTLNISPDTAGITTDINNLVTAFNSAADSINNSATYNSTTQVTGILFGDGTTNSIINNLATLATSAVPGLPSTLSALSQVGITLDTSDHLNVNSTTLANALSSNLSGVAQLFQATGVPTNPLVQFVNGGPNTQPSGPAGYAVQVTTPASQATYTASVAQTQPLAAAETLTFGGPLFGTSSSATPLTGQTLALNQGSTAADIVSQINGDSALNTSISASLNTQGELQLTSKQYGQSASFSVVSTANAADNTSGIGTTVQTVTGTDVAGTINGETATGSGQFLSDTQQGTNGVGAGQALGLQLRVTATAPGSYGTVSYTSGFADQLNNYVNTQVNVNNGTLTLATSDLQSQYNDLQTSINAIEAQVTLDQQNLTEQFTAMETSLSDLKASSAGLSALLSTSSLSSTSTSSSSSSTSTGTGTSSLSGS